MYANHINNDMTELHITRREFADLPIPVRSGLMDLGNHVGYAPGVTRGPNAEMIWHLTHTNALCLESLMDEYR